MVFRSQIDSENKKGHELELWSDDNFYLGEFKIGLKEGQGIYVWNDGSRYQG